MKSSLKSEAEFCQRGHHSWAVVDGMHDNADRTRTWQRCLNCRTTRYGCYAKRLDGDGLPSWGKVGEWKYYVVSFDSDHNSVVEYAE